MDGKQARRTKSGSALGLLFDHGCDALNCTLGSFVFASSINTGPSPYLLFHCFNVMSTTFFWATWEQYHTGEMILPIINGPSEGNLVGVLLAVSNYFLEPKLWGSDAFGLGKLSYRQLALLAANVGVGCTVVGQTINVIKHTWKKGGRFAVRALYGLTGFVFCTVCGYVLFTRSDDLVGAHPFMTVFMFGLINLDMFCSLMLAHIANADFRPFRPIMLPLFLWTLAKCLNVGFDENLALFGCLAVNVLYSVCFIYGMGREVRDVLGIYAFSIKKRDFD
eukprot:CAMPEP_0171459656 /NCGR_PEP_ID=MMETSP0945-20130129/4850_1 /TAXON_ID=109269 /ORGANISM="Vaucheria litorea, Strain CCMP2940" /LENGTH=277 /DNA_ID=CAMNT_0011985713 /DNA_START=299 /DNA_END=1132 /DNA_ORIENTATION=+